MGTAWGGHELELFRRPFTFTGRQCKLHKLNAPLLPLPLQGRHDVPTVCALIVFPPLTGQRCDTSMFEQNAAAPLFDRLA